MQAVRNKIFKNIGKKKKKLKAQINDTPKPFTQELHNLIRMHT